MFLNSIVSSVVYIWSFYSSWLISFDGFYNEENITQPSSSSGSHARRLFDEYRKSFVPVDNFEYDTNPKVNSKQDSKICKYWPKFFFSWFQPRPGTCFQERCSLHGAQGTGAPKTSICWTPAAILSGNNISCFFFYISLITAMARIFFSYFLLFLVWVWKFSWLNFCWTIYLQEARIKVCCWSIDRQLFFLSFFVI